MLVFGAVELRRLQRELETLDDYIRQVSLREAGKQPSLPRTSRLLEAAAAENHLNLLKTRDREQLAAFLTWVLQSAPQLHMSFAVDPSAAFTAKIVAWLRGNIHPQALVHLGLQPTIAAGCVLRTTNKTFDFSLRERFTAKRQLLVQALDNPAPTAPPQAQETS